MQIDLVIQRHKLWILLPNVIKNDLFVISTQVQIFQPYQIALVFHPADNSFHIRYFGKYRRDKTGRSHPCIVKRFHCRKAAFYADRFVHIVFEILVQSVDAESYSCIGKCFYQLYVTQHQIRFCLYTDLRPAALKLLQKCSCTLVLRFLRIVWVGNRAYEKLFAAVFVRIFDLLPMLSSKNVPQGSVCTVKRFINEA